ncbi:hypothetical protein DYBT9623_04726 [Dyadobacter sp. CECT 9623]|uniref:Secretion system C-terminal sorting domain-containing protein n=1 Tax=Dyadobacter linearis TaxID=2823330 RepID=A0ABM8UWS6_9BACT|nr:BspA family leucine-rich repeat surface protein [Dyadobacter sp. CECT 9623]CAG5073223.1 hypothetical protein DYBT9623_04726 [Dyadobacter sp. CECT 9623]
MTKLCSRLNFLLSIWRPLLPILLIFVAVDFSYAQIAATDYVTIWKTDNAIPENTQISIPAYGEYTLYYESIPAGISGTLPETGTFTDVQTITFPAAGTYRVAIKPTGSIPFHRITFGILGGSDTILEIEQWGTTVWSSMEDAYVNCSFLTSLPETDLPVLSSVTSMRSAFNGCRSLTGSSKMNDWDVGNVTDMQGTFTNASVFNQPIGKWDVSNVTSMLYTFNNATVFNQSLADWDVSSVTNMRAMFWRAEAFNQPINSWNVSNVTTMRDMFLQANSFNQPLDNWNVANVSVMRSMFEDAVSFNQPLGNWNVTNVNDMGDMFRDTEAFDQPLNNWNVSNVTLMASMFRNASAFNQPLSQWTFSPDNINLNNIFTGSGLDCGNYSTSLIGWAANPNTPDGIILGADGKVYGPLAVTAHDDLITNNGWTFNGDSFDATCAGLPVTLVSFGVKKRESSLLLTWSTAEETNSERYEIQRSADSKIWKAIGIVASAGESRVTQQYQFNDHFPMDGISYYRLKMVDKDLTFAFSGIEAIEFSTDTGFGIYPNPASDRLLIDDYKQIKQIEIYNASGLKLLDNKRVGAHGLDLRSLMPGIHTVKMYFENGHFQTSKLVISR